MIKVENSRIKSVQHYLQKAKEFVLDNPINQLEHKIGRASCRERV